MTLYNNMLKNLIIIVVIIIPNPHIIPNPKSYFVFHYTDKIIRGLNKYMHHIILSLFIYAYSAKWNQRADNFYVFRHNIISAQSVKARSVDRRNKALDCYTNLRTLCIYL